MDVYSLGAINIEAYMFYDINVKGIIELKDVNFYEIRTSLNKEQWGH